MRLARVSGLLLLLAACPKPADAPPPARQAPPVADVLVAPQAAPAPSVEAPVVMADAGDEGSVASREDEPDESVRPEFMVSDAGTTIAGRLLAVPCVKPAAHAAVVTAGDSGYYPTRTYQSGLTEEFDLDGDGVNDIVVAGGARRWEVEYWLYLKRGTCGHFLGRMVSSGYVTPLASRTRGLADVKTSTDDCRSLGGLGHGYCEIVWRFDGRRYVAGPEKKTNIRPSGIQP
jgi:hypothetical protein